MFTTNLLDLTPEERVQLRILTKVYATESIIGEHYLANGAHRTDAGGGIEFFEWHRRYLHRFDDFLRSELNWPAPREPSAGSSLPRSARARALTRDYSANASFTKLDRPPIGPSRLPFWRPWDPIPPEFLPPFDRTVNDGGPTGVHQPHGITRNHFAWWLSPHLQNWKDADRMGGVLSWGPHFKVHALAGGSMSLLHRAPEAAIFWPWHAFLDNIYSEYLASGGSKGDFDYNGKYPPWAPQPPPEWFGQPPQLPAGEGRVRVPFCLGSSLMGAKKDISDAGLTVGDTYCFHSDLDMVGIQWPMPNKSVDEGTKVHLASACDH